MRSETEVPKQYVNIGKVVSLLDQEKERERETTGDSVTKRPREDAQHATTRTEGDSEYPRVKGQKSERENGKRVLRASGIVIEPPIGSAREGSSRIAILDTLEEEGNTMTQLGHKTPGVRRRTASGPPKEPLPGRLVNRPREWKKIGGDKQVSCGIKARWKSPQSPISLEEGKHRQEFRGTTEMTNNYLSLLEEELKDGVVKPMQESEVKWFNLTFMVRKKNGKWRKILDCRASNEEVQGKHFKMDSQETVLELLEENDGMTTLDISSECQHSFHEDNETGSVIYQRKVEVKASDTSRRHTPYAHRQVCIEIDLTGDSPVPEKSGMDAFRRETEAGTHKERGVSGMVVELGEDGSDTPGEEESAAPGGCAKVDSTCKEEEETKDEGLSSTHREAEFCEASTHTSELVDEAHAIRAEAGNSPRRLERDSDTQPNDVRRINTLEENSAREQTKESEEKEQTSRANNRRFGAGMGCSINNTNREQRGEDICPRKLDPPGECVSDKREGVQSSVEDTREKGSMAATTDDRPYSFKDRQHVHEVDDSEVEGSAITHSNTESIGDETEQPGHYNTDGTSSGRAEHGSRFTQSDGEKAGLRTEGGEGRGDIANSRTENTRYNFRTNCTGVLRKEDEGSPEGTNDSDSASLAGTDLDPAAAAWAFDKDPGDLSGVHDTGSYEEKGRLEITPRRGYKRYTGEENIQGRDIFFTWGEHVGAIDKAAAILKNQKSERETWRALRRFKQFLERESIDDTVPLTTKDAKWIMAELTETLLNTNLSSGVIHQMVMKGLDSINLFRETKIVRKDIETFLKTNAGEKPMRGMRYKSMWDLSIITKWA
ncbi:uncharacterized protein MONOS_7363 [Monocercomonoides exilis]|uniref:uncharacterized protein n=1 Tax=Monocercomonoides exilis TaxID=2049356 RepID=UPI003559603C|nr:hypothetical protein MONOS_7363 [Monocercomonoides exilis]|eukprot:MONOS_7363.1-p1 / transcript=MONOS_7363.1 / gene=MONOS_7363 / organism=Monocercomonoides_exilis_PA203 / gene_product=unspecified product / transcript_product=unspecified product / location=Mono_scaffold00249:64721-67422(+) / protein_length=831 / sequence_SO=supercontig / SO=protein_coding / is_pseudo=false